MNTNHNRIKVSDLEKNQSNKILTTNSEGEIGFSEISTIKIDRYNGLDYIQDGKALDARQGKILNDTKIDKALGLSNANKLLGTDENGNLKMFALPKSSGYPAPYINEVIADSYLPSNTGNIELRGEFFIPDMCMQSNLNNLNGILLQGQTINYANFINSQKIVMNVTTSSVEGDFNITCNNGQITTKSNVIFIVVGEVFKPTYENMTVIGGTVDITEDGCVKKNTENSEGIVELDYIIPKGQNFQFRWTASISPLRTNTYTNEGCFVKIIENGVQRYLFKYVYGPGRIYVLAEGFINVFLDLYDGQESLGDRGYLKSEFYFQRIGTQLIIKEGAVTIYTFELQSNIGDIKIQVGAHEFDIVNLKYIKLV